MCLSWLSDCFHNLYRRSERNAELHRRYLRAVEVHYGEKDPEVGDGIAEKIKSDLREQMKEERRDQLEKRYIAGGPYNISTRELNKLCRNKTRRSELHQEWRATLATKYANGAREFTPLEFGLITPIIDKYRNSPDQLTEFEKTRLVPILIGNIRSLNKVENTCLMNAEIEENKLQKATAPYENEVKNIYPPMPVPRVNPTSNSSSYNNVQPPVASIQPSNYHIPHRESGSNVKDKVDLPKSAYNNNQSRINSNVSTNVPSRNIRSTANSCKYVMPEYQIKKDFFLKYMKMHYPKLKGGQEWKLEDTKINQVIYELSTLKTNFQRKHLSIFEEALSIDPTRFDILYMKGTAHYHFREFETALFLFNDALCKLERTNIPSALRQFQELKSVIKGLIIKIYYKMKDIHRALIEIDNVILSGQSVKEMLKFKGLCYLTLEDYDKAIVCLDESVSLGELTALDVRRKLNFKLRKYEKSIEDCDKLIEQFPTYEERSDWYMNKGECLFELGLISNALDCYKKAASKQRPFHYMIGICNMDLHNYEQAIEDFKSAMRAAPNDEKDECYSCIARILVKLERYNEATEYFNKINGLTKLDEFYDPSSFLYFRALYYFNFGNISKCFEDCKRAEAISSEENKTAIGELMVKCLHKAAKF